MSHGQTIHYAGALRYVRDAGGPRETTVQILPGFAACVSGLRAEAVRKKGNHSVAWASVTCKRCIDLGERAS
jgi:hypothetical protein